MLHDLVTGKPDWVKTLGKFAEGFVLGPDGKFDLGDGIKMVTLVLGAPLSGGLLGIVAGVWGIIDGMKTLGQAEQAEVVEINTNAQQAARIRAAQRSNAAGYAPDIQYSDQHAADLQARMQQEAQGRGPSIG